MHGDLAILFSELFFIVLYHRQIKLSQTYQHESHIGTVQIKTLTAPEMVPPYPTSDFQTMLFPLLLRWNAKGYCVGTQRVGTQRAIALERKGLRGGYSYLPGISKTSIFFICKQNRLCLKF